MSIRGYKINDEIEDMAPSFDLTMVWDALEPYVLNAHLLHGKKLIETFEGSYALDTIALDINQMKTDLNDNTEHAQAHAEILGRIVGENARDVALYTIG